MTDPRPSRTDWLCAVVAFALALAAVLIVLTACLPADQLVTNQPGSSVCDQPCPAR